MNQPNLTLRLLAVAERIDGPESWVHLCTTAAHEAVTTVLESPDLREPSSIAQAISHIKTMEGLTNKCWEVQYLVALGEAYVSGQLIASATGGDAAEAAAAAFRNTLPPITNRRSVQSFVACVAAGVLRQYITAKDANALLVAANAALSAHPKRNKTRK